MRPDDETRPIRARDIFEGPDVVIGGEIVDYLKAEGIGVLVTSPQDNKKISYLVDRKPGVEDLTVRQIDETEQRILGIVLPTRRDGDEFVFLGIHEEGFVFRAGKTTALDLSPVNHRTFKIPKVTFISYADNTRHSPQELAITRILTEVDDPEMYKRTVLSSVENERKRIIDSKGIRVHGRRDLFETLFGG